MFLSVDLGKTTRDAAIASLANEGIVGQPHALSETAIEVTEHARRVQNAQAYQEGLIEVQDAASGDCRCSSGRNGTWNRV